MSKTPKPPPKPDDEEQSKRFLDLASELEAAGELNPTDGTTAFERVLRKAAPPRTPTATKRGPQG